MELMSDFETWARELCGCSWSCGGDRETGQCSRDFALSCLKAGYARGLEAAARAAEGKGDRARDANWSGGHTSSVIARAIRSLQEGGK